MFAFDAIIEKRPIKFVLLVLLAAQFHFPALIFLPAYWLGRMRLGQGFLFLLGGLLIATFFLRDQILRLMLESYGGENIYASMEGIPTEGDTVYNACLVFSGVAFVFQSFCGYNNIFDRLADYYFHTSIVFLPLIFEQHELKSHVLSMRDELTAKRLAPWVFSAFAVWRFLSMVSNSPIIYGYSFLWQ